MQTSLAEASRALLAAPRSPSGWKKRELSTPRQAASSCQSQRSAFGPGRREKSAMGSPLGAGTETDTVQVSTPTVVVDVNMTHWESSLRHVPNGRKAAK